MPNENSISQKSYKNFELVSEKKIPDCDCPHKERRVSVGDAPDRKSVV